MHKLPRKYEFYRAYSGQRDEEESVSVAVRLNWPNGMPSKRLDAPYDRAMPIVDMLCGGSELTPGDVLALAKAAIETLTEARACLKAGGCRNAFEAYQAGRSVT
jgi:hypothetical protein